MVIKFNIKKKKEKAKAKEKEKNGRKEKPEIYWKTINHFLFDF